MKKYLILLLFILLLTVSSKGQFPIIEEYNIGTSWTFTNGAGIQNYGGAENYATTNIGSTPYPNDATVTITSPVYDFTTSCGSDITISFPIIGRIENGFDFLYLEYFNAGAWVNLGGFTGPISGTYTNTTIPNTATRFRFRLVTDCSVNGYKGGNPSCSVFGTPTSCLPNPGNCSGLVSVYYYDITRFTIDCSSVLPIDLLEFNGYSKGITNYIYWVTSSETNNDYFTIERSRNAINWDIIGKVEGAGNSNVELSYHYQDDSFVNGINYYRLKQTDFDGNFTYSKLITINSLIDSQLKLLYVIDLIGRRVSENYTGYRFEIYEDGIVVPRSPRIYIGN